MSPVPFSKLAAFVFNATTAGLAVAFVMLYVFPELLGSPNPQTSETPVAGLGEGPVSYSDAVHQAAPAVVNIYTTKQVTQTNPLFRDPVFRRFFGDALSNSTERTISNLGSAVILSNEGYLLTNNHLITGGDEIQVMLQDGRATTAEVVGTDPETDLAVLRIGLPDLPTLLLNESEQLQVGNVVLAIGNPFGVGQTVTMGIVSATGRHRLGLSTYEDFIQTDAAINPGNSGGALIDARGQLVGINTAIFGRSGGSEGIGFAIPIELATKVMQAIVKDGYVARGWLGAEIQPLTRKLAAELMLPDTGGVRIGFVVDNSPASRAGLTSGDIITHINGDPIASPRVAINYVADVTPGDAISMNVVREGKLTTVKATVGERPREGRR